MGARLKKRFGFYSFLAWYCHTRGVKLCSKGSLWNLGRQADMWELIVTIICVGILVFCMYRVHTKLFKPTVKESFN